MMSLLGTYRESTLLASLRLSQKNGEKKGRSWEPQKLSSEYSEARTEF